MARAAVPIEQIRELRVAAAGFRALPSAAQQRITRRMRSEFLPALGREVGKRAALFGVDNGQDVAAFADQRFYTGTNPGIAIGTGKRQFSGGATSADIVRGLEFGANRTLYTRYRTRTRKGRVIQVERRATRQFPPQKPTGYIAYPALAEFMPTVAAAWVGMVADMIREAMGAD